MLFCYNENIITVWEKYLFNNQDICKNYVVNVSNEECFVNNDKVLNEMITFWWVRCGLEWG